MNICLYKGKLREGHKNCRNGGDVICGFPLMNICPYKEKLKEGQKNGQNGKIKHCSEYVIYWEKCNKKISPKFGQ